MMRILAAPIMVASLVMGAAPVMAKDAVRSSSSEKQSPQDITVSSIQVVDVEDLPSDLGSQIDEYLAHATQEELQSLQDSIGATPQAVDALEEKGRAPAQVVAIIVDESGVLTIFTRRPPD
jgi:hypothetical protein